jgi:hypothetical protein
MAAAIVLITIGSVMAISAVKGISVADVLKGVTGGHIDPKGGATSSEPNATQSVGGDITKDPLGGIAGTSNIDGRPVANWLAKVVLYARAHGWRGKVTSGVRSDEEQRQACIHVCGNPEGCPGTCAKPGESNHRGTIWPLGAVDVSDPDGFERAIRDYPGGPPIKRALADDPVHFSVTGH